MWKKLCAGVLLLPALAIAEPVKVDKPIVCDGLESLLKYVVQQYGEQPIWFGTVSEDTQAGLFINPKTGTWSFMTASKNRGCLIDSGVNFQLRGLPPIEREGL